MASPRLHILAALPTEREGIQTEIEKLGILIEEFQTFFEEFACSNQANVVSQMAEKEFNSKWKTYNSLNVNLIELNQDRLSYQNEIEWFIDLAKEEECSCIN